MTPRRQSGLLLASLALLAIAPYLPAVNNGFVEFDDDDYVYGNSVVSNGLTWNGALWAFTTGHAANYHPVTWLSHMLDVTLYELHPTGHHVTNVVLHTLVTLALFLFLQRATAQSYLAWFVAALFAVHPLHVESVAWVSERKDLLCAFFSVVTLYLYTRYTERRSPALYALILVAFALALLSKPMAVTLPFLLLVIDYWPKKRLADLSLGDTLPIRIRRLVAEKLPLFALALLSSLLTYLVQQRGGAMLPLDHLAPGHRIANAAVAYVLYVWKLIWPTQLSPIYPHPGDTLPLWQALSALALLLAISALVWVSRGRTPYALSGWLWFVGMLVPVSGIVQVGYAAMADRYMYLSMTGILIVIVWSVARLVEATSSRTARMMVIGLSLVVVLLLSFRTVQQVGIWRDSETLFKHAIAVTEGNAEAYAHLGVVYLRQNRGPEAVTALEAATRLRPSLKAAWTSLGVSYRMTGDVQGAVQAHEKALSFDPEDSTVHSNLGYAYAQAGSVQSAEKHFREALRINPEHENARKGLVALLQATGRTQEAEALQAEPKT
ncbi:MAG TPA: tetratricopeptide repeat protein [Candidatus Hydrogenedentes bacterium]|mgnify:CR=1 FL=1|nr:tetratricopeptide repeat protein [Candidatus Hydrogenedentota bacterium]